MSSRGRLGVAHEKWSLWKIVYDLLEKTDRSISKRISCLPTHPLYNLLPRVKESSKRLRTQTSLLSCVNTERFKAILTNNIKHVIIGMYFYLYTYINQLLININQY